MKDRCYFTGCKRSASWACRKLYGDGAMNLTCDQHKPDIDNRPASIRHLPFFYDVQPIGG